MTICETFTNFKAFMNFLLINNKYFFSLITVLTLSFYAQSQSSKVMRNYNNFTQEYYVQKADTSVKNGSYKLFYKKKIIEVGNYIENRKSGLWQYFSLDGIFEYEYNFDKKRVVKISGEEKDELKQMTPCLFLGSPLIPYLYIVNNIHYPEKARKLKLGGKVILALKISKEGELWSIYLYQKLEPVLDSEVMRVARTFPDNWQWLPATRNGVFVDGEYLITIEFELD